MMAAVSVEGSVMTGSLRDAGFGVTVQSQGSADSGGSMFALLSEMFVSPPTDLDLNVPYTLTLTSATGAVTFVGLLIRVEAEDDDPAAAVPPAVQLYSQDLIPASVCATSDTESIGLTMLPGTTQSLASATLLSSTPTVATIDVTVAMQLGPDFSEYYHSTYRVTFGGATSTTTGRDGNKQQDIGGDDDSSETSAPTGSAPIATESPTDAPTGLIGRLQAFIAEQNPEVAAELGIVGVVESPTEAPTSLIGRLEAFIADKDPEAAAALGIAMDEEVEEMEMAVPLFPTSAPSTAPSTTIEKLEAWILQNNPEAAAELGLFVASEIPSDMPSLAPSMLPSDMPSLAPSLAPSLTLSVAKSEIPSDLPSLAPSTTPSGLRRGNPKQTRMKKMGNS